MIASGPTSQTAEYRRFQTDLADEISPDEALAAEEAFRRGRIALWTVAGVWAALVLIAAWLPSLRAESILSDVAFGLLLVACPVLGARYRIPYAGRLLLPFATTEMLLDMDLTPDTPGALISALFFVSALLTWGFGWLLDLGVSPEAGRTHPWRSRILLLLFATAFGGLQILLFLEFGESSFPIGMLAACVVCALWRWWPGLWVEAGRLVLVPDAERLLRSAAHRWLAQKAGGLLAVLFAAFPLFLFLNHLGLDEKGLEPAGRGEDLVVAEPTKARSLWYWPMAMEGLEGRAAGRYLRVSDLGRSELYVVPGKFLAPGTRIQQAEARVFDDGRDAVAFKELRDSLAPFRLKNVEQLSRAEEGTGIRQLGRALARPSWEYPRGGYTYFVFAADLRPFFLEQPVLQPTPAGRIRLLEEQLPVSLAFLAVCGLLSFLLLWRRGGDSPVARWMALFLAGSAAAAAGPYAVFYLPALCLNLWTDSLRSPVSSLVYGGLKLLEGCSSFPLLPALAFAALWVYLAWPPRSGRRRWSAGLGIVWRSTVVLVVSGIVFWTSGFLALLFLGDDALAAADTWGFAVCSLAALWLAARRRRRCAALTEIPDLGPGAVCAFLAFQGAFWIALLPRLGQPLAPWTMKLGLGFLLAFVLLSIWLILRRDFLHLAAGRDLGQILLVGVLPFLFERSEELSGVLLGNTLFSSEAGKATLGLVIVIALFGPLQRLFERYAAYAAVSGLRRIEKAVEGSLEGIVELPDAAAVRQAAARFFEEMRVAGALLYRRSAEGRMERLLGSGEAPAVICPSERLQRYLAHGAGTALDLRGVALDWRCFFLQHELFRLERETGCRYLLPIRLGSSLRGLLLLPDGADSRYVCRDLTGAQVGKLGLVVAEAGRVEAAS